MVTAIRLYFLVFYAVSILVLLLRVLPAAARAATPEDRARGTERCLPAALLPIGFLVPPAAMLLRVGELPHDWISLRLVGVALSAYAAMLLPWTAATMGHLLVPQAVVFADHRLVTSGPFRLVRHPAYSGDLALWLGCALGTLDVILLALWPLYLLGAAAEARVEERLLASKFGAAHADYSERVGRFLPWPARRARV